MIVVTFNKPDFEYDVHSLIKAFFANENVQMYYSCNPQELSEENVACTAHAFDEDAKAQISEAAHVFEIKYEEKTIEISWEMRTEAVDDKEAIKTIKFDVEASDKQDTRNKLKQNLYDMISEGLGVTLPWGTLTGIRPTKIAMHLLEDGMSETEVYDYMKENYLASDEKIKLSIDIARREKALLSRIDYENGYSLYIGIPFCPSTCLYCSFTSYPLSQWKNQVDAYLDALEKEIDFTAERFANKKLNSIYIGGGTPTTLEPYQLDRLIKKIKSSFDLSYCVEFTVEAGRPDSITREKLQVLKDNGIDRISVNPQTMKQETLDIIGRHHTVEDTIESFKLAREVGISNINMDLIMGLPEEDIEDVRHTMEVLRELDPDNITIHSLAIKRAARLTIFKDRYQDMQMVNTQEHMDLCADICHEMGLEPYYLYRQKGMAGNMENVGYAKSGRAGVYNILIMEEKQTIMALGAGASTKFVLPEVNADGNRRIERVENVKDVKNYLERIDEMIQRKIDKMEEIKWH